MTSIKAKELEYSISAVIRKEMKRGYPFDVVVDDSHDTFVAIVRFKEYTPKLEDLAWFFGYMNSKGLEYQGECAANLVFVGKE